jgi:hypothetical protein
MEGHYEMVATCKNCFHERRVNLVKGLDRELHSETCPYCGCETRTFYKPVCDFEGRN